MFEKASQKVLPPQHFIRRMLLFCAIAGLLVVGALTIGTIGYHWLAGYGWVDGLLNATMILAGMGQIGELNTRAAKLFATAYALFSSVVFITVMGMMLAPIAHRLLHKFHMGDS